MSNEIVIPDPRDFAAIEEEYGKLPADASEDQENTTIPSPSCLS